ncbi:MAG: SDR family oxidoreductase [bacterium]|nr:SDR family oxidoreductase [bacterium]
MATYLVTGGAGFIGSHLVRELVRRRQKVVVLDNLVTGKLSNLADVRSAIRFLRGDIRNRAVVRRACLGADIVLHQAALRSVGRSVANPEETSAVNIEGTVNVLIAARDAKVRRCVSASSSSVYGGVRVVRNTESLVPRPASPYAVSKLAGEHFCRVFSELYGLHTVSLRYFNVFGPFQDPHSPYAAVIPIFVSRLLRGVSPEIHGTGRQSRDFTYVANVVEANLRAATGRLGPPGAVINIGNGENTSIMEMVRLLQRLLGVRVPSRFVSARSGDVFRTHADITKARRLLGYRPTVSFAEGLQRTVAWYQAGGISS